MVMRGWVDCCYGDGRVDTVAMVMRGRVDVTALCLLQLLVMVALRCVEGVPEPVLVRLLQQTLWYV